MKLGILALISSIVSASVDASRLPNGVDPIALYQNVRSTVAAASETMSGGNGNLRSLQTMEMDKLTTRCFTECVEQNMTPEQCEVFIQLQVSAAVGGHEVGPLTIKIQEPRSAEEFADSYWLVEVPVNLLGRATCDRNEGKTFYPFGWNTESGTMPVAPVDCLNLKASECCKRIRAYGMGLGMDTNDMCLACFPHQEPLVPRVATNENTGIESVVFEDYLFDGSTCFKAPYSEPAVNFFDDQKRTMIMDVVADIDSFLNLPMGAANCGALSLLLDALYDATVTVPQVQEHLGRLSCGWCWSGNTIMDMDGLMVQLQLIRSFLDPMPLFDSTERCVIIYTDQANNIADVPKIGGSRADDDFDDDCPPDDMTNMTNMTNMMNNTDMDMCLQSNVMASDPIFPGFIFDDVVNDFVCPTATSLVNCTGEAIDHTLEFINRTVVDVGNGVFKTQFVYKACNPELDCRRMRKLRGDEGRDLLLGGIVGGILNGVLGLVDDLLSPMSSISIGMTGQCTVTNFAYLSLEVDTPIGIDANVAEIGLNTDTCVAGFSFTADWDSIQSTGCTTGNFCRNVMLEVDGIVPLIETEASISFSNAFALFPVMGPNCTACESTMS